MEKPEWFNGEWYSEGDTVTNPFSGESYKLTGPELSMYDFIMGVQLTLENLGNYSFGSKDRDKLVNDFDKAIRWFQKNNIKAYMTLLD